MEVRVILIVVCLLVGVCVQGSSAASLLGDMVNKVLVPPSQSLNSLNSLRSQLDSSSTSSRKQSSSKGSDGLLKSPRLRPLPTVKPPSPLDVNRGFGRVLSVVSILGQIDSYMAERAKSLVRKLLLLVDDDAANSVIQY